MSPLGDHISVGPVVRDQSDDELNALRSARWSSVGLLLMFIAFLAAEFALYERGAENDKLRAQLEKDVATMQKSGVAVEQATKIAERAVYEAQQSAFLAGLCVLKPEERRKEMLRVGPIQ